MMVEIEGSNTISVNMGRFKLKGVVDASFTVVIFFSVFTSNLTASNPFQDELCKGMFCGEGRCEGTDQFPFVECICNPGWTNFNHINSLPCVLPNCTINSQCGNATPAPPQPSPATSSFHQLPNISDPCSINFCGVDGSCVLTNGSDFNCQCSQGSTNFLNNPKFPCFHKCNLGEDCKGDNFGFNEAPPPLGTPSLENSVSPTDVAGLLCGVAFCGKGSCEDSNEFPFVKCICDEGWTNFNNNSHLPCVIPNCTVDFSCGNGSSSPPPPPPQQPDPSNPCWINICGLDGKCERDGSNPKCQCSGDSANLFGNPKFPCFKKCHLGGDCNGLDLGFNQPSLAPPPPTNSVPPTNGNTLKGLGKLYILSLIVLAALLVASI